MNAQQKIGYVYIALLVLALQSALAGCTMDAYDEPGDDEGTLLAMDRSQDPEVRGVFTLERSEGGDVEGATSSTLNSSIWVAFRQTMANAYAPSGVRADACGEDYYIDFVVPYAKLFKARVGARSWSSTYIQMMNLGGLNGIYGCYSGWCQLSLCSTSVVGSNPWSAVICFAETGGC